MLSLTPRQAFVLTGKFVLWQLVFFVLVGLVTGFVAAIRHKTVPANGGVDPVVLIFVNSTAAFLVLRGQMRKSRLPWGEFFHSSTRWVLLLPAFFLIMVGEALVVSEINNGIGAIASPPSWLRTQFSGIGDLVGHPFSAPFVLVVVAAVTEEFLFRGLILRGLLAKTTPLRAVVLSAAFFAVMHLNPWQMTGAFLLGLILGWVYLRTRSLALCLVGHGFLNAVSLLASGLPFTVSGFNQTHAPNTVLFQPWWFNLIGVTVLAGGAYFFHRAAPVTPWPSSLPASLPPLLPVTASIVEVSLEKK